MATWLSPGIVLEPTARFSVLAIAGSRGYAAARFRRARGGRFTGLSRRRHDGEAVVVGEEEKEEREDEGEWRGGNWHGKVRPAPSCGADAASALH